MGEVIERPALPVVAEEQAVEASDRSRRLSNSWVRRLRRLAAVILPFFLWDWTAALVKSRLLPGPAQVFEALLEGLTSGSIWFHAQLTAQRGLLGLAIAVVFGVIFGVLLARVRWMDAAIEPLVAATYAVPKLALFPLLVLLLGFGGASKVAMVAIECAYPIILTTYAGVQAIDKHYFWLARNVEAGVVPRFLLMIRATTPAFMASLRMAAPIMLVIIVVTEMIGESRGLGYLLRQAGTEFNPSGALAVILLLAIIGFVNDRLILFASRRANRWAREVTL